MGQEKLGSSGKFYRNTGTFATPTWTEIPTVRDLTRNLEAGEADASSRGSRVKLSLAALLEISVEADLIYDPANAAYDALLAAAIANPPTTIEFADADGAIATTGTRYMRFHGQVFNLGLGEPLEDAMTNTFMTRPVPNANANPTFVTVP